MPDAALNSTPSDNPSPASFDLSRFKGYRPLVVRIIDHLRAEPSLDSSARNESDSVNSLLPNSDSAP
jgi:hypothetical protein